MIGVNNVGVKIELPDAGCFEDAVRFVSAHAGAVLLLRRRDGWHDARPARRSDRGRHLPLLGRSPRTVPLRGLVDRTRAGSTVPRCPLTGLFDSPSSSSSGLNYSCRRGRDFVAVESLHVSRRARNGRRPERTMARSSTPARAPTRRTAMNDINCNQNSEDS